MRQLPSPAQRLRTRASSTTWGILQRAMVSDQGGPARRPRVTRYAPARAVPRAGTTPHPGNSLPYRALAAPRRSPREHRRARRVRHFTQCGWNPPARARASRLQAELLQAVAQRVARDPESPGRAGLVAAGLVQRPLDDRALPLRQVDAWGWQRVGRRAVVPFRGARGRERAGLGGGGDRARERPVLHVERGAPAPQHRALDDVAQLAHGARPAV